MTTGQPTATATPRTNAFIEAGYLTTPKTVGHGWETFARTLERELSSAQAARAEAKREATAQGEHAVAMTEHAQSLQAALAEVASQAEKLNYVHRMGLRFGMMMTSDKPEPYLAHTWDKDSDHERMFREWSDSIGIKVERDQLRAALDVAEGALVSAARYVPINAVTAEWKTKPVKDCRLVDHIEQALARIAEARKGTP